MKGTEEILRFRIILTYYRKPNIRIVLMSALVSNGSSVAAWLESTNNQALVLKIIGSLLEPLDKLMFGE